jgi:hypothetical protein
MHSSPEMRERLRGERVLPAASENSNWLVEHGLINNPAEEFAVEIIDDWQRLGSETYTMHFKLASEQGELDLIAKACIKIPCAETFEEWQQRRRIISDAGITTPVMYDARSATVIEEYVPYSFAEAYAAGDEATREQLKARFSETYTGLISAGFRPMSLHDVRSHGSDVVIVDFGEDLGGPGFSPDIPADEAAKRALVAFAQVIS